MSLNVYLILKGETIPQGTGVFVRDGGSNRELTEDEVRERFPNYEPVRVAADPESEDVFSYNITHNLNTMAGEAGVYQAMWHPEEIGATHAHQITQLLRDGLARLEADPDHFRQFNSPNGWGMYENLVTFAREYLAACERYPLAEIRATR